LALALVLAGSAVAASAAGILVAPAAVATVDPLDFADPPTEEPAEPAFGPAEAQPLPSPEALKAGIDALDRTGLGSVGIAIASLDGDGLLVDENAGAPGIPASSHKILTATAALSALGAEHRFTTRVVREGTTLTIVGGGDPFLMSSVDEKYPLAASVVDLARSTAEALRSDGVTAVDLFFDGTLFTGDGWHPAWTEDYHLDVSPITALVVDAGLAGERDWGEYSLDPAGDAATAFATALTAEGINVSVLGAAVAAPEATEVARVDSLPLRLIIQQLLLTSDNVASEMLLRHIGLAGGQPGSFIGGAEAMRARLTELGLWAEGMVIDDGSGLSLGNRDTPAVLAAAVRHAFSDEDYSTIMTGLPTAGVDGTLHDRFDDDPETPARGLVRAKTGTLTGVRTLTGLAPTAAGGYVAFSFLCNDSLDDYAMLDWLDRAGAALVTTN
jgi:D-alanyl-D-alanine carboxypeptidase/D-alanyl-D-alanine-endopeptidase (penicillin-binding protein 4)